MSTTAEPCREEAVLAQAEVGEHACRRGLVGVAPEGDAIENDEPARQDSAGGRERGRVQHDQIHRIGAQVNRRGARRLEAGPCGVEVVFEVNRDVDITARRECPAGRAAEQIGELDAPAGVQERTPSVSRRGRMAAGFKGLFGRVTAAPADYLTVAHCSAVCARASVRTCTRSGPKVLTNRRGAFVAGDGWHAGGERRDHGGGSTSGRKRPAVPPLNARR